MSTQDNFYDAVVKEISSLHQQVTVTTIVLGAALKEVSLQDPDAAKRILENVTLLLDSVKSNITSERAIQLRDLLETGLKEGIKNEPTEQG